MNYEQALKLVDQQYAATEARLTGNPEWEALREAARIEERDDPSCWIHRNLLAIRREIETPLR